MSTENNKCELCGKIFSSKYSLGVHLKKTKSCGSGSKITYECSFCCKKFTQKSSLDYHLANACEDKKDQEIENNNKKDKIIHGLEEKIKNQDNELKGKLLEQDAYYDKLIVAETMSKEKLKNEVRIYKETIEKLEKTVEGLHERLEKMASTKSVSTVINGGNTNNITLNMFITPEFVKSKTSQYLTYDYFANGIRGIANFVHEHILIDENGKLVYACYDKARHVLRYKDDNGTEIDDIDAEKLIAIVSKPIQGKYTKICKELKEDIERYKNIIEDKSENHMMRKEASEKKSKAEISLQVMNMQSTDVCMIGMSKNKKLSRELEKICLVSK